MGLDPLEDIIGDYLSHESLLGISRSIGAVQTCLVYPNTYELGIANLGFNRIWQLLSCLPEISIERTFLLRPPRRAVPKSWETKRPFGAFQILAFSVSSEEDYPAVIEFLITSGIPTRAGKRSPKDPIIIAGGLAPTLNPLPLSLHMDALFLGDGELLIPEIGRIISLIESGWDRSAVLESLSKISGVWVPELSPLNTSVATWKLSASKLGPARSMALSLDGHFGKMFLIEVGRGCGRLCNYCATCYSVPNRTWQVDTIVDTIEEWIPPPGPVGLVGAALSDYPDLETLIDTLVTKGYGLGLSSFRADILDLDLLRLLRRGQVETITIAPEAGSEHLRATIGKPITDQRILETTRWVAEVGFPRLRCYFMTGLPGETEEDIEAIITLCRRMNSIIRAKTSSTRLDIRITPFVPKAGTPFQWAPFALETILRRTHRHIQSSLEGQSGITLRITPPSESWREALFSRGDQLVGMAIEEAIRTDKSLRQTAMQIGVDLKTITRSLPIDQSLPWDGIRRHTSPDYLARVWQNYQHHQ